MVLLTARLADASASPRLFGTSELRINNLKAFVKWTGMLDRHLLDGSKKQGPCTSSTFNKCHALRWQELIDQLQGADLMTQLQTVNTFMNKARYIVDSVNWAQQDYWATPEQFFRKFGDCEDYAISKYLTLRKLGIDPAKLRIVAVQDLNLRVGHAILAVYTKSGIVILDNQIRQIAQATVIHHYKPIYSINEKSWWMHRP